MADLPQSRTGLRTLQSIRSVVERVLTGRVEVELLLLLLPHPASTFRELARSNEGDSMAEDDKSKALGEATRVAEKRLREAHPDEYNGYKSEEAKARGVEWTPRLTDEQKAEKQLADLLAKHPHLKEKVARDDDGEITLDLDS